MKLSLAFLVLVLMSTGVRGEVATVTLDNGDVSGVVYNGRELKSITVAVPEVIAPELFLSASARFGVSSIELASGLATTAIAQFSEGHPIYPQGKEGPVSTLVPAEASTEVVFDMTPIIRDILAMGQSSVTLVLGAITGDEVGTCEISSLDPGSQTWGIVEFRYRTEPNP